MTILLPAFGLMLVVEGLVFALAPRRIEAALIWLASLPVDLRRLMGLVTVAVGVALLWLAKLTVN